MHIIPTAILFVKIKVYLHALLHQIYLRINEYLKVKEVSKNSKKGTQKSRKIHIVQSKMLQPQLIQGNVSANKYKKTLQHYICKMTKNLYVKK